MLLNNDAKPTTILFSGKKKSYLQSTETKEQSTKIVLKIVLTSGKVQAVCILFLNYPLF